MRHTFDLALISFIIWPCVGHIASSLTQAIDSICGTKPLSSLFIIQNQWLHVPVIHTGSQHEVVHDAPALCTCTFGKTDMAYLDSN